MLVNPDIIMPAQQAHPIPIVVSCTNVPLSTAISGVVTFQQPKTGVQKFYRLRR